MPKRLNGEQDADMQNAGMREFFGPAGVDIMLREALKMCWTVLPTERRSVEGVEQEIRRLVERALRDMKDDATAFGFPEGK